MNRNFFRSLLMTALALSIPAMATGAETFHISAATDFDFRALQTFTIRAGQISSEKPEIDNRLFRQRLEDSMRAALKRKGLKEDTVSPDVFVSYHFEDRDISAVERQPAGRVRDSPLGRGFVIPGSGPNPVLYAEGTLIIDLTDAGGSLLWRGTHRDREQSGPRLSRNLSEDAGKLLSKFPPKRR